MRGLTVSYSELPLSASRDSLWALRGAIPHMHSQIIARDVQAWYCSADCQRVHWKEGGHKKSCKELQQALPTKVGATRASTTIQAPTTFREAVKISERGRINPWAASPIPPNTGNGGSCIICLQSRPPAIQSGCGCRGDAGLAHIKCRVQAAEHKQKSTGDLSGWETCSTCGISFTARCRWGWQRSCSAAQRVGAIKSTSGGRLR